MQISVTSGSCSSRARGPRKSAREEGASSVGRDPGTESAVPAVAPARSRGCGLSSKRIDAPEVHVARDQDLDALALVLDDGGWDGDRAAQHFRDDVAAALW